MRNLILALLFCFYFFIFPNRFLDAYSTQIMKSDFDNLNEPNNKRKLRFFNLDLHISVIADVKDIFESLGHEVVDWSISGHTWVFERNRDSVEIVNEKTWKNLSQEMCDKFYERYKDYLSEFDGFIITHNASFSLLYEKFNKPIIIVNSSRYENPFTAQPKKWNWLNNYLIEGIKNQKIFIVSNNKGDQAYLKYYTGIESTHIPSLCLYTDAKYTGNKDGFIFKFIAKFPISNKLKNSNLMQNHQLPDTGYKWEDLYDFKGIVHFPYQISTMSLFEQYSANIPLFFPSKEFLVELQLNFPKYILNQLSFSKKPPISIEDDLNNINNLKVLSFWIDNADYYDENNMPHIQYFDSFQELEYLLQTTNCEALSRKMEKYNIQRKEKVFKQWKEILEHVTNACD